MKTAEPVPSIHEDNDSLDDTSDNDALIAQALNPDGTPRRPMNAFMIFARRRRPEITANNPPLRTGEISKVLSSEWAAMTADSKQFYLDRARKLKDNFNARWPDYVYRRRPNNTRKRKRPDAASTSGPPVVRRCASPGREPVVPSSKIKYEDGYQHPCLPSIPSGTGAPLTMMYLGEAEHGRSGMLGGYNGSPLPSLPSMPYSRAMGTPSLASSILTSASTSPRSVSSTLHSSYRFNDQFPPLTNSPSGQSKMGRVWKESVLEGGSSGPFPPSNAAYSSPYGAMSYLPKTSSSSFDEYTASRATDQETRQGEWTPPHGVRNNLSLPSFAPQNFAYEGTPEDTSPGFQSYPAGESQLEYDGGLVPVHPHFQRS
ncbi:hypothetical protein FRC07_001112 [Ceratobasidium sp. 392]|nr:hypothetical protein FRC07_001112 [Ceratobasidium sp. 392]